METKKTKVTLLTWTQNPLESVYAEWVQSRTEDQVPIPAELAAEIAADRIRRQEETWAGERRDESAKVYKDVPTGTKARLVQNVFEKVIAMKMPLGETIDFIFLMEHVPIALREQNVRHRIGHKFGDKLGADIIPDLAGNSTFWSQTTRIINLGKFADDLEYYTPVWLQESGNEKLVHYYHTCMWEIQEMYKHLVESGMPLEDARGVLPMYLQHRYTWKTNLSSIMHVLSKRGCWLAQLGMWEPVIHDIVNELATKIHPLFRRLIDPPCFDSSGNFNTCAFHKENEEIVDKGEYPPCSLWLHQDVLRAFSRPNEEHARRGEVSKIKPERMARYEAMIGKYTKLWHRNPRTGERVQIG